MRNLILSLFIFFGCSANAQHEIDADVCTKFVHSKINELNVKIWDALHSGEIVAYTNDSLTSTKNSDEIYKQTTLKTTVMVSNPENPDDPYDLISKEVVYTFDSSTHFKGINLHYAKVINGKRVSFRLVSVAPLWKPVTESGIDLGLQPLFQIRIKDIKKLKGIDYGFYEALFATRASVGDFVNPYFAPFEDAEQLGQGLTYNHMAHSQHYMNFSDFHYTIVGHHLAYLPISIAIEGQRKSLQFFKDAEMKQAYIDVQSELQDSAIVMVTNPENPEDPYDLIPVQVFELFEFERVHKISVIQYQKDVIINFKKTCVKSFGFVSSDQCERDIYYPLGKSKKLIKKTDWIVLETLLTEIIT